jgi:hypothetical protein
MFIAVQQRSTTCIHLCSNRRVNRVRVIWRVHQNAAEFKAASQTVDTIREPLRHAQQISELILILDRDHHHHHNIEYIVPICHPETNSVSPQSRLSHPSLPPATAARLFGHLRISGETILLSQGQHSIDIDFAFLISTSRLPLHDLFILSSKPEQQTTLSRPRTSQNIPFDARTLSTA